MKVRILAAVAALALGTAISTGAAQAATYLLDTSDAFGAGSFGEVTVTGTSTDLHFDVQLFGAYQIVDTGSHFSFSGNLTGLASGFTLNLPSSEYYTTGHPATSQPDFTLTTGTAANANSPFSGFNFALNCNSCGNGASAPFGNHLIFDILGTGLSVQPASSYNNQPVFFASDVTDANGNTGAVGGGPFGGGGVPEPASWAMMIMGIFTVGGVMRQRRAQALTAA
jgi:hypothetical protein